MSFTNTISGQYAQFQISGRLPFFMAINDSLMSDQPRSAYFTDSIKPGEYLFTFVNDSSFEHQQLTIGLPGQKKYVYELVVSEGRIGILPVTETAPDTAAKTSPAKKGKIPVKKPAPSTVITGKRIPGLTLDSLRQMIQLQGYNGRQGCSNLMAESDFDLAIQNINQLTFEREKLGAVQQVITMNCLRTGQMSRLLDFFEFDDTRLNLLNLGVNHIFDLDNLGQLQDKFSLTSSREKFRKMLSSF